MNLIVCELPAANSSCNQEVQHLQNDRIPRSPCQPASHWNTLLRNLCYTIIAMPSLLCNLCYAIFAMKCLLCNHCFAIFAVQSLLCNLCFAIFAGLPLPTGKPLEYCFGATGATIGAAFANQDPSFGKIGFQRYFYTGKVRILSGKT